MRTKTNLPGNNIALLKDYPTQTKEELRKSLINDGYVVAYSGKVSGFYYHKA